MTNYNHRNTCIKYLSRRRRTSIFQENYSEKFDVKTNVVYFLCTYINILNFGKFNKKYTKQRYLLFQELHN